MHGISLILRSEFLILFREGYNSETPETIRHMACGTITQVQSLPLLVRTMITSIRQDKKACSEKYIQPKIFHTLLTVYLYLQAIVSHHQVQCPLRKNARDLFYLLE